MGAYTVKGLMMTSVDDCRVSLGFVTDLTLLRQLVIECHQQGHTSRAKIAERRIRQLKKEAK